MRDDRGDGAEPVAVLVRPGRRAVPDFWSNGRPISATSRPFVLEHDDLAQDDREMHGRYLRPLR